MRVAEISEHNKEINKKLEKHYSINSSPEIDVEIAKLQILQDISQSLAMIIDKQ